MVRIGISGWRYAPWRKTFYPATLKQDDELAYASRQLPTIEINGTFYGTQHPQTFADWYQQTPPGFVFSVKGARFITHVRRLNDVAVPLANFFAQGLFHLREKLGPFLWQFPPNLAFDPQRFETFVRLLPQSTGEALHLAQRHDARFNGRAYLVIDEDRPLRHAIEVRNESFRSTEFVDLLRAHNIALVVADSGAKWPEFNELSSDFMYLRLHGADHLYASGYTEEALGAWKARIDTWSDGRAPAELAAIGSAQAKASHRDVYCYFDNDLKVKAPENARRMMALLGLPLSPQ